MKSGRSEDVRVGPTILLCPASPAAGVALDFVA
jgi:hypothetical protein